MYDNAGVPIRAVQHGPQENRQITKNEVRNRFGFHKATLEGPEATLPKHAKLRVLFTEFADTLNELLPDGRNKAIAFNDLEAASMWAHKSIATRDPLVEEG